MWVEGPRLKFSVVDLFQIDFRETILNAYKSLPYKHCVQS